MNDVTESETESDCHCEMCGGPAAGRRLDCMPHSTVQVENQPMSMSYVVHKPAYSMWFINQPMPLCVMWLSLG